MSAGTNQTYSPEFKAAAVKKLISLGATAAANELKIPISTIYGWRSKCVNNSIMNTKKSKSLSDWTPEEKLLAVAKSMSMNEHELGEYLRQEGLYSANLEQWKQDFIKGIKADAGRPKKDPEINQLRKKEAEMESELKRKDKALAEFAARIVLLKKSHLLFGPDEDN